MHSDAQEIRSLSWQNDLVVIILHILDEHSPNFKAKVALAAIKGDKTLVELSEYFDIHANQITQWKTQLLERNRPGKTILTI